MSDKELEIFNLCERLAELLGDKEAIADLKKLYDKHPEMFNNMQEVSSTIKEVVEEPEIIVDATHSNKNIEIYKAAKRLDDKKMGDIVIKNESGTNEIFHANKKNIKEFERLKKQVETGGRDAHFLHPDLKSAWAGSSEHSPANGIIPQNQDKNTAQSQTNFDTKAFSTLSSTEKLAQLQRNQESISQMTKASEILNHQESTNDLDSLQRDSNQDSKESQHKIRKHK